MGEVSEIFNYVVKGGLVLVVTEIIIFTLVHANTGGMSLMATITPPINDIFDAVGVTDGMHALSEMLGGGTAQMAADMGGKIIESADGALYLPNISY
jgi:hypothetical protein